MVEQVRYNLLVICLVLQAFLTAPIVYAKSSDSDTGKISLRWIRTLDAPVEKGPGIVMGKAPNVILKTADFVSSPFTKKSAKALAKRRPMVKKAPVRGIAKKSRPQAPSTAKTVAKKPKKITVQATEKPVILMKEPLKAPGIKDEKPHEVIPKSSDFVLMKVLLNTMDMGEQFFMLADGENRFFRLKCYRNFL